VGKGERSERRLWSKAMEMAMKRERERSHSLCERRAAAGFRCVQGLGNSREHCPALTVRRGVMDRSMSCSSSGIRRF
jgi:hypothetical protein